MELVYLWVEEYKNIQKQGFNFSPRFNCEYNDVTKELTIDENDEYIENFFGENINVTAIVGKNGSGKSSFLDLILELVNVFPTEIKLFSIIFKENELILNDLNMLKININIPNKDINIIQREFPRHSRGATTHVVRKADAGSLDINYISLSPMLSNLNNRYNRGNLFSIYNTDTDTISETFNYDDFFKDIFFDIPKQLSNKIVRELFNIQCKPKIIYFWFTMDEQYAKDKNYKILSQYKISSRHDKCDEYEIPLDKLDDDLKVSIINLKKIIHKNNKDFHLFFKVKTNDKEELHFSGGEFALMFYIRSLEKIKENSIVLIDEFETYLHPDWQKKFLSFLIKFLKKNIQVIIATHSPFIISDLPRKNIIFLDKGKQIKGIEKKQTFGANIHTLLSDSFFMEDGLMGEFAKGKIDKAIKLLNQDKLSDDDLKYCEQIISIIGEPIVKSQLQRMLDSKRLSKIDVISQKIKDMSYELEILKEYQSKIVKDELRNKGKKQYKQRLKDD